MDKLQELTQRLYEEGLAKGKEEGEALLAKATADADELVRKAHEQAEAILLEARREAADYRTRVEGDVKMAATETLQATRLEIERLVRAKTVDAPVGEALTDPAFIREMLLAVARNFTAEGPRDLSVVLPEKMQASLAPFVEKELAALVGNGLDATFSRKIAGGFRIGPKDGGYYISLTDETFRNLIGAYLRPATLKLLFGEEAL